MRCAMDLLNSLDESLSTIARLSQLGGLLDDGGEQYFANCIEILAIINREVGHAEKLSTQLVACVRPTPRPGHGGVMVWP
jgi:hypothetical protein